MTEDIFVDAPSAAVEHEVRRVLAATLSDLITMEPADLVGNVVALTEGVMELLTFWHELPTQGGAVEGTTDQGTSGGEAAADDGRAGADSREVGAVVPEVLPASQEGGAGQPSAGAPPQLIGLDPRDEDVPEYVNDVGDRVMVLYDHAADRIELGLQDTHMDRPTVFMTWYGVADSGVPEEHKVRLEPEQANTAGQRLLDLAAEATR